MRFFDTPHLKGRICGCSFLLMAGRRIIMLSKKTTPYVLSERSWVT
jgi:hypothetical protein